jgi:hypothetical protein
VGEFPARRGKPVRPGLPPSTPPALGPDFRETLRGHQTLDTTEQLRQVSRAESGNIPLRWLKGSRLEAGSCDPLRRNVAAVESRFVARMASAGAPLWRTLHRRSGPVHSPRAGKDRLRRADYTVTMRSPPLVSDWISLSRDHTRPDVCREVIDRTFPRRYCHRTFTLEDNASGVESQRAETDRAVSSSGTCPVALC